MSGKMGRLSSVSHVVVFWFTIIHFGCVLQAKSELGVGPWGGQGGDIWTYEPKGDISHIKITYDDVIHSVCFTSKDENGNLDTSKFPCKKAGKTAEIDIDVKTEKLNSISGTFDTTNNKCSKTITSLSFATNSNKTYGPFGTMKGTAFSLMVEDEGFSGFHGSTGCGLLESIGVNLGNLSTPSPITEDVGIWGGPGGEKYDYMARGELSHIAIDHNDGIRFVYFSSINEDGVEYGSRLIGGPGVDHAHGDEVDLLDLDFKNGERLVGMSGTFGYCQGFFIITSLQFYTNKGRTSGPASAGNGTAFSYMADPNKHITGFYGGAGLWLDSIGLHIQGAEPADKSLTFGQWGNSTARRAWTYQPDAGISHISITYKDSIYSIKFTGIDGNGTTVSSEKFGKNTGREKAEIDIDPKNEKLIGISGTVGAKKGWEVITSVTFFTDKNRTLGPFGTENGTAFSVPLKDGFISGFHGRSGRWVEAIGVYVKPI